MEAERWQEASDAPRCSKQARPTGSGGIKVWGENCQISSSTAESKEQMLSGHSSPQGGAVGTLVEQTCSVGEIFSATSIPDHRENSRMPRDHSCRQLPPLTGYPRAEKQLLGCGRPAAPLFLLFLASWACICQGVAISPLAIQTDKELQLWNKLDNACSDFLSVDPQPQASSELEDLCYTIMGILPKPQFLFHYSKTHDSGNSDVMSSVVHPLLQLVPQLHERRMKRFKVDEESQGPGRIQSRGYFLFRPRNGRRSPSFR
uniref:Neuromedin U n=1 Tax=Monodelphis domestica TaxID=13616 RepID=A0A5F8H8P8_MONDO